MRRLLSASLGVGIALSAVNPAARGIDPTPPQANAPRPAARLVAVRPMSPADATDFTARSQMGEQVPKPMPPGGNPMGTPTPVPPAPMGGGQPGTGALGMPRPFGQGPNVTELRNGTTPPVATLAPPVTGQVFPVAGPFVPLGGGPIPAPVPAADGGLFPCPELDAPLVGGACPGGLAAVTSAYNKWWLSAEYLLWWTKSAGVPPLLTTSSPAFNGIIGQGDTRVLFGNQSLEQNLHSGGRFGVGYWFGTEQRWAAEGSVFFLGRTTETFTVDSMTTPVIARPFVNLNTNQSFAQLIASPGLATGSATVRYETSVWGAEANLRRYLAKTCCTRLDLIAGFRYLQVDEDLRVGEFFARTPNSPPSIGVPTAMSGTVSDSFRTENEFYGGQVGMVGEARRGRWFATLSGKVALGTVYQTVYINGQQNIAFADGTVQTFPGGLLALPGANMGTHKQDRFAVVPEVGFNIGYHLTPHCRIFFGYNFLYLSSVLRPGQQIDTGVDVTRIPNFPVPGVTPLPQPRPVVTLKDTDFFAQGLNVGLQFTW